jgi:FkbM family methyltransferase
MLVRILRRKYEGGTGAIVHHAAIARDAGEMTLYNPAESRNDIGQTVGGSIVSDCFARGNNGAEVFWEKVTVIDLSAWLRTNFKQECANEKPPVYLLKMDIEGAEFDLLEKMITEGTCRLCRHIVVETHERMFADGNGRMKRLEKLIAKTGADNISLDWA